MKYYLYRHISVDKNDVFYIGIGTTCKGSKDTTMYKRAYAKYGRNNHWHNIVNKTNYLIEIIFESNNYDFIKEKECEFIKIYGRKDIGKGNLVNKTDGGEGYNRLNEFNYKPVLVLNKKLKVIKELRNAKEASFFIYKTDKFHKKIRTNCKLGFLTNKKYYVIKKESYENGSINFKIIRKKSKPSRGNCKSFNYRNKFYETKQDFQKDLNISRRKFDVLFKRLVENKEIIWMKIKNLRKNT